MSRTASLVPVPAGRADGRAFESGKLRVIGVTSGKGGVGKTTVAVNLALQAAQRGRRVLLIDGDLGLANVEILLGHVPPRNTAHLLDGSATIDEVLVEGPWGLRFLPGGSGFHRLARLDEGQKMRLLAALDPIEDRFDLVIIDSPAGIGGNALFFVGACQEAILVVTPEPTSLTDAYVALKGLSEQRAIRNFHVVVNQSSSDAVARQIFEKLCRLSDRFLDASLHFLGPIPRDEHVPRSIMAQRPLVALHPLAPASRALGEIAHRLLETPPPATLDGGLKFLWQRLFLELGQGGQGR